MYGSILINTRLCSSAPFYGLITFRGYVVHLLWKPNQLNTKYLEQQRNSQISRVFIIFEKNPVFSADEHVFLYILQVDTRCPC